MKEEQPQGSFHIQEERRLFYVAVTRARHRLTLNTVVNKRSKPSPFLDDILMDAQIKRRDVEQIAPAPVVQPEAPTRRPRCSNWPHRHTPRRFANRRLGRDVPLASAGPAEAQPLGHQRTRSVPSKYLFSYAWGSSRAAPRQP